VGFVRQRRSPAQHFCSHECRRALERVWERERHWAEARTRTPEERGTLSPVRREVAARSVGSMRPPDNRDLLIRLRPTEVGSAC
jgi:hypothetical protein